MVSSSISSFLLSLSLLFTRFPVAYSAPYCALTGTYFYQLKSSTQITFSAPVDPPVNSTYIATCTPFNDCGWNTANVTVDVDPSRPWSRAMVVTFLYPDGSTMMTHAFALGFDEDCATNPLQLIYFDGTNMFSAPWCAMSNPNCSVTIDPIWTQDNAQIFLTEVSHSDIGWLGLQDDILVNNKNINQSLSIMDNDPNFVWQHECILFLRAYVDMYGPEAEAELITRIAENKFDIGGTFTELFETPALNEILARQMYTGRKWFVTRYPGLDSAVVAFHQDGPLRSLQTPQIYNKAGMRYLKPSRYSEEIVQWIGADDRSRLLAFPQVHYCVGMNGVQYQDILYRMALYAAQYKYANFPPVLAVTWGCDYAPPDDATALFSAWQNYSNTIGNILPPLRHSTFKNWMDVLSQDTDPVHIPMLKGERPNIWIYENSPTHHNMWSVYRDGGRLLPAAETFWTFLNTYLGSYNLINNNINYTYPSDQLDIAWLNLTLNDHGISDEPVPKNQGLPDWLINDNSPDQWDEVYLDKWTRAKNMGDTLLTNATTYLTSFIDFSSAPKNAVWGITIYNTLSWTRSDPVFDLPAPPSLSTAYTIIDSNGNTLPYQLTSNNTLMFTPLNVPSLGYATYFLVPQSNMEVPQAKAMLPTPGTAWTTPYTNTYYTITPGNGGIQSIVDIQSGLELFDTTYYDIGEWMELEYTGMGASEIRSYPNPVVNTSSFQRLGNLSTPINWTCIEAGPVRVVFSTAVLPTHHSSVQLLLEVYTTIPRLDLRVNLYDWDSAFGIVNRVVFPMKTSQQNISYAVPFGVVQVGTDEAEDGYNDLWLLEPPAHMNKFDRAWNIRPREIGDWIHTDLQGTNGVTISSSVGAFDWIDITGVYPSTQPVLAPEMLIHTNSNRGPFLPEPGDHYFLYSIVPTSNSWNDGWQPAVQANNPLRSILTPLPTLSKPTKPSETKVESAITAPPALPLVHSFMNVSSADTWITTVKKEDGATNNGVITRLFSVTPEEQSEITVTFDVYRSLTGAAFTNLIELEPQDIEHYMNNSITFPLSHWSIETFRLNVF